MRRRLTLRMMQQQVRGRICPHCAWRPEGSESLGSDTPRSCQGVCTLFRSLSELMQVAQHMDSMLGSYERTMQHGVSRVCAGVAASGRRLARQTGPLGRYRGEVIAVLHTLVRG